MKKLLLLLLWVVATDALAAWRSSASADPRPFPAPQHSTSSHQEFSYYRHDLATARSNPPLFLQVPNAPSSRSVQRKQSTQLPASLIPHDDAWGNWAALTGFAAVSQVLGQKTMIGRLLGAPVTAMACTFAAASVGILHPGGTAAARALQLLSLQLATPLILLGADLRYARQSSGPLLVSFAVAATGTLVACAVGWRLAGAALSRALPIGGDGLKIAAALLAKNIGGGINYIAVCRSLDASATAVAAGLCVDNLFALVYFPVTSALANGRPDVEQDDSSQQARHNKNNSDDDDDATEGHATRTIIEQQSKEISTAKQNKQTISDSNSITVQSVSTVLFLSATLLWLGEAIGGVSGGLPACTVLTVVTASLAPNRWMQPLRPAADNLGLVALYLFFATAGAPGMLVAESVKAALIPLSVFLTCLYSLHGAVLMLAHKFCGNDKLCGAFRPQRLLVASSAAIGGPATAVALAASAQWPSLAVPSILVGNIGYAIATFCGLGFYAWFR